jgi:SAM-dependent methyltransferase
MNDMSPSDFEQVLTPGMERVSCDLCRADDTEMVLQQRDQLFRVTNEEFSIVRCRRCGLVYLNPRPSQISISRYYPTSYYPPVTVKVRRPAQSQAKQWSARIKRWVLEDYYGYPSSNADGLTRALRRMLLWPLKTWRELKGRCPVPWRGEGEALDIGCGAGGNLKILQDQGWKVSGVEISEVAAVHARRLIDGQIHIGTVDTASLGEKTFDLILMSHSLEHLPSPVETLRRVHRLLRDEGLLIVTVPNIKSLERRLFGFWWFHWDPPRHFYHFDRDTLSRAMSQARFQPVHLRTGVGSTFFLASFERWWTQRFGSSVPGKKLFDRLLFRPVCFAAGHAGYGTELTIYATKA